MCNSFSSVAIQGTRGVVFRSVSRRSYEFAKDLWSVSFVSFVLETLKQVLDNNLMTVTGRPLQI